MKHRLTSIIQLCIVFSYILWAGGYPFTGELYQIKSKKLIYESVINNSYFEKIPFSEQKKIRNDYSKLQKRQTKSFLIKFKEALNILFFELSPFTKVWILLSLIIPFLLIFQIEGAVTTAWLIPIIVLFGMNSGNPKIPEEVRLFPTEKRILSAPLNGTMSERYEQLKNAWNLYLMNEWGNGSLPRGEFAFNLARIEAMEKDGFPSYHSGSWPLLSLLNFIWSVAYALTAFLRSRIPDPLPRLDRKLRQPN